MKLQQLMEATFELIGSGKKTTGVSPAEAMARFCSKGKVTADTMEKVEAEMKKNGDVYEYNGKKMKKA